jgi:hypothetical protein
VARAAPPGAAMAVIRLQMEVDSEVYPELYERLRAIARP